MKYKVGDRVACTVIGGGDVYQGGPGPMDQGVIVKINPDHRHKRLPYAVRFDKEIWDGYSCNGSCERSHGWWCSEDVLEFVDEGEHIELDDRGMEELL